MLLLLYRTVIDFLSRLSEAVVKNATAYFKHNTAIWLESD